MGRVPFIPQMESVECGAASLAMVLAAHGHHAPLPEVRQACGVSREGASAYAIVRAARGYGMDAEGVQAEIADLGEVPWPAILHWGFNHFVVLESVDARRAVIVDPALGRLSVEMAQFRKKFTGVLIALVPGPGFQPRRARRPSLARYASLLRLALPSLGLLLLASLILQLLAVLFPAATQLLIDQVIVPRQERWLVAVGLGLSAAVLARAVTALARGLVLQATQVALDASLMTAFCAHLLHLPLGFFLQRRAGDLAQRLQAAAAIRNVLTTRALSAVLDGFQVVGYGLLMLAYDPGLAAVVFALALLRVALILALRERKRQLATVEQVASGREWSALVEAFSALETTRACQGEGHVFRRWAARAVERTNAGFERTRLEVASSRFMVLLQGAALALVFLLGGRAVIEERLTLGAFGAFLALQGLFLGPLEALLETIDQLQYVGTQLLRVDDVLETAPEPTGAASPGRLQGRITLERVSFAYAPGAPPVLQDVSLEVAAGERLALVGASGAGKSTLARLLLGVHLPTSGRILFDGRDLRELDLAEVRRQVGVVLQDTFLFDDTVRANLALHDPSLPLPRLREAARLACIDHVIDALPHGWDTVIGENGRTLSGGERQRLALARALAREAAILLLDEATSALDLATEAKLQQNLEGLGCTQVVIAHRLATVRTADRIVVLEGGRVVQSGRYQELAEAPGLFRELVSALAEAAS